MAVSAPLPPLKPNRAANYGPRRRLPRRQKASAVHNLSGMDIDPKSAADDAGDDPLEDVTHQDKHCGRLPKHPQRVSQPRISLAAQACGYRMP